MQYLAITFNNLNISLQAGDLIFYVNNTTFTSGFDITNEQKRLFGTVFEINGNTITVEYDDVNNTNRPPSQGDYVMFAKDQSVNKSGLKGYYLKAKFINSSKIPVELYCVGSEVSESSK